MSRYLNSRGTRPPLVSAPVVQIMQQMLHNLHRMRGIRAGSRGMSTGRGDGPTAVAQFVESERGPVRGVRGRHRAEGSGF